MKKFYNLFCAVAACLTFAACSGGPKTETVYEYPFLNPNLSIDERVEDVLSRLTVEEKVSLMMNGSAAVERLGIPAYNWWNEALHGVGRAGLATVFPQAIGMAAGFDADTHYDAFTAISDEARAKYNQALADGTYKQYYGLTFWTPNINIFRDPRWGRGQETYGEDPYLTGRYGVAAVKGLQGDDPDFYKTHACAKHYAVHSGPEWNRHSYNAVVSMRDLWETYLPAFRDLVRADVQEVMCAYNSYEGVPCCGSDRLLIDILRNKWNYAGLIVSDCGAINDFYQSGHHETHENAASASAAAVLAGTDIECGGSYRALVDAVNQGIIKEEDLDVSLRRIFKARIELGMFDPAENVEWNTMPYSVVDSKEHRDLALKVARQSMTLLKNDGGVLPLSKDIKTIAVVGANADDTTMMWGNYNGTPSYTVSILQGIKNKLPNAEVIYDRGCDLVDKLVRVSQFGDISSNGSTGLSAKFYGNTDFSGEPIASENVTAVNYAAGGNTAFAANVPTTNFSARFAGTYTAPFTGKVYLSIKGMGGYDLKVNGKSMAQQQMITASMFAGQQGGQRPQGNAQRPQQQRMPRMNQNNVIEMNVVEGRDYQIALDYRAGDFGTASLSFDMYEEHQAEFTQLTEKVKGADVIIYAGGLSPKLEGEEMPVSAEGFRGGDRERIDLPDVQKQILSALHSTGKPVVFVVCSGSSLTLTDVEPNYQALLEAWYGGQEGGTAVADVLFGDYNPAGRLPVTFYKSIDQLPDFQDYNMNGRTYRYMTDEPLYAFGYGLSYTTFEYGKAKLSRSKIKAGSGFSITVPVKNAGSMSGDEVVQVYVKSLGNSDAPVKSLKGFKRVNIKSGKSAKVKIAVDASAFEYYDSSKDDLSVMPGQYEILYGSSSRDADLQSLTIEVI